MALAVQSLESALIRACTRLAAMVRCDSCRGRFPVGYQRHDTVVLCFDCWTEWGRPEVADVLLDEDVEQLDEVEEGMRTPASSRQSSGSMAMSCFGKPPVNF